MKYYYYAQEGNRLGPLTLDELKKKRLKQNVLVWTEGMETWKPAGEVIELADIIFQEPPPLPVDGLVDQEVSRPKKVILNPESENTDSRHEGNDPRSVAFLLIILMITLYFSDLNIDSGKERAVFASVFIVIRIGIARWVFQIANRLNRNSLGWGIFSFITPIVALLIIGNLKKLIFEVKLDENLSKNQNALNLLEQVNKFYKVGRYSECLILLEKVSDLVIENTQVKYLRASAQFKLKMYEEARVDFESLIENSAFGSDSLLYLGRISIAKGLREEAVSNWTIAKERGNKNAQYFLDLNHEFTGRYLLDSTELKRKIGEQLLFFLGSWPYIDGILAIEESSQLHSPRTILSVYENGLDVQISRDNTASHIGIAFYEINDIVYNSANDTMEITGQNFTIKFSYNLENESKVRLKKLCSTFEHKEGKPLSCSNIFE